MGRKARHAGPQGSEGDVSERLKQAETLLDGGDPQAALACLDGAIAAQPTSQAAWYLRGVAAAELWEIERGQSSATALASQPLQAARDSFARVVALDTSKRSESRYLAALAGAKLLAKAAAELDEDGDAAGPPEARQHVAQLLAEAQQGFQEALRLHEQWGHEELGGDGWGAWGAALALEARRGMADVEREAAFAEPALRAAQALCAQASQKFAAAATAATADDADGSAHWLTLHAELLVSFTELACTALSKQPDAAVPAEAWAEAAQAAWREAGHLANGILYLSGGPAACSWETLALHADVLAAGAGLLGGLAPHVAGPSLELPSAAPPPDDPMTPAGTGGEQLVLAAAGEPRRADESECAALAAAAYEAAAARGGRKAAAVVGLAAGEMLLGRARRMLRACGALSADRSLGGNAEFVECCRKAGASLHMVARLSGQRAEDPPDAQATAWYNIACLHGLTGEAELAAQALQSCAACLPKRERGPWLSEASTDDDLASVRNHPDLQAVLAGRSGRI